MQDKVALRRQLRRQRMAVTPAERRLAQAQVTRLLKPLLRQSKNIGMYLASGSELDIAAILQDALQQRCQLYAPYIEPNQRRLWFSPTQPLSNVASMCSIFCNTKARSAALSA